MHFGLAVQVCIGFVVCVKAQRGSYRGLVVPASVLELPELPYSYAGLKPHLNSVTLRVHHQGHHKAYCDKTNAALQEWRAQASTLNWPRPPEVWSEEFT